MSKKTLLEIVQYVLSAMEADNVNSISATVESVAIARVVEETFYELISQSDWPHLETTIPLDSSSDLSKPNFLKIPENVKHIKGLWYNDKPLKYMDPEKFINFTNERDLFLDDVVESLTDTGVRIKVVNSKDPTYFTVLNDKYIITDSFDITDGSVLYGSKAVALATTIPIFQMSDEFVPDLPENMVPTFLAMVKRSAFLYFRREPSNKDERAALAGWGRLLQEKSKLFGKQSRINYGRRK